MAKLTEEEGVWDINVLFVHKETVCLVYSMFGLIQL